SARDAGSVVARFHHRGLGRRVPWAGALVAGLIALMWPAGAWALSWSAAVNPVRQDARPGGLAALSCPSTSLCVAADGYSWGDVLVSANPLGGATTWSVVTLPGVTVVSSVSCPDVHLCVAGDGYGNVWTSTNPTGGFRAWRRAHLEEPLNTDGLSGISCPSVSLCVASDVNGNLWSSANPTGGRTAWHHSAIQLGDHVNGPVSCPSTSLCVTLDDGGRAYATRTPLTGGWSATGSPADQRIDPSSLACPSSGLCLVSGNDPGGRSAIFTSNNPAGAGAWTETVFSAHGGSDGVSCASAALCFVFDKHGDIFRSTTPTGGAAAWQSINVGKVALGGVACPGPAGCVAVGDAGGVLTAPDPAGPWSAGVINGWSSVTGVACPTTSTCIAVDSAGNVLHTRTVASTTPDWSVTAPRGVDAFGSIACLNARLCIAGSTRSSVWLSRQPAGGPASWQRVRLKLSRVLGYDAPTVINDISCPSPRLCVAVDNAGDVVVTTTPTGAARGWKVMVRLPAQETRGGPVSESLTSVTCPSSHLCIASDAQTPYLEGSEPGMLLTSRDPSRRGSWHGQRLGLSSVSCPTVRLCLAATADGGRLATTSNPTGGRKAWKHIRLPGFPHALNQIQTEAVSCAGPRRCVVAGSGTDGGGIVATSTTPTVARSWSVSELTGSPMVGVRCRRGPVCIAYSDVGEMFVGR
ncbi:MAG: hypothetical protein ACYDHH_23235, partial [Solirubrobacteraceae bacterium]